MKRIIIFAALIAAMSCGKFKNADTKQADMTAPPPKEEMEFANDQAKESAGSGAATGGLARGIASVQFKNVSQIPRARLIIKTSQLGFEVEKYDAALEELQKLTDRLGGFITSSTTEIPYENIKRGTIVLRIPAEKFEATLIDIKKLAKRLESEGVQGQDVTEEFYDLEARLNNKKLAEKQTQDILKRAGTIHDVLEVQRELTNIREDIERFEGRKKFLADQASLSTITVNMHDAYPLTVSSSGGFWATIGDGFGDGFRGFAQVLSGTIAFVIAGSPIFIIIGLGIWALVRWVKRSKQKKLMEPAK